MRVFEEIRPGDYVRRSCVRKYKHELASLESSRGADTNGTQQHDKLAALRKLPPFEKQAWHRTRAFYAINRNSRAAALRLRLSRRLLLRCKQPGLLPHIPEPYMKKKLSYRKSDPDETMRHEKLDSRYLAQNRHCLVVQLFHTPERGEWDYSRFDGQTNRLVGRIGDLHATPPCEAHLRAAEHVVLLGTAPHNSKCCAGRHSLHFLSIVQTAIEKFWQKKKLKNRRISVFL